MKQFESAKFLLLAFVLLVFPVAVLAADTSQAQIKAQGEGTAAIAPDMAIVTLTVTREAETARAALDENSLAMAAVIAAMGDEGVAGKDLHTSNLAIQPRYTYPKPRGEAPPKLSGYTVRNSLTVRVRDLPKLGALLDKSVSLGVNEGGNIRFTNDDPSAALSQARTAAVKDALARADTMARAAGVKPGRILEITESSGSSGPRPMMMESMAMARSADAVPVATGENIYRVSVTVSVAIDQ